MRSITDYADQELRWTQPSGWERAYELRAGEELLATLRFLGGTLAEAETAEGRWTLEREGFLRTRVTVRAPGSDTDLAVFRPHWAGGGDLVGGLGEGLEFASASFWHSEWVWRAEDRVLISYRGPGGLLKANAAMELAPEAGALPNVGLLAVLGWYLLLLFARDVAVATAARGSTVVPVMH